MVAVINSPSAVAGCLYSDTHELSQLAEMVSTNSGFDVLERVLALDPNSVPASRVFNALPSDLTLHPKHQVPLLRLAAYDRSRGGRERLQGYIRQLEPELAAAGVVLFGESTGPEWADYLASLVRHADPLIAKAARFTLEWNAGPERLAALEFQIPKPTSAFSIRDMTDTNRQRIAPMAPSPSSAVGRIAIVGPTAAGKSSVAPLIAAALKIRYVELDRVAASLDGRSVGDIIRTDGREAFIDLLNSALLAMSRDDRLTLIDVGALGLLDASFREQLMSQCSPIILLDATPRSSMTRLRRTLSQGAKHAAATMLTAGESTQHLLAWRRPHAFIADTRIPTDDQAPEDVANTITTILSASEPDCREVRPSHDTFPVYGSSVGHFYRGPSPHLVSNLPQPIQPNQVFLDIGAGTGRNTIFACQCGYSSVALEPSVAGIQRLDALSRVAGVRHRIRTVHTSIEDFAPQGAFADVVAAITSLDHIDPVYLEIATNTLVRCMKRAALLIASVFTVDDPGASGSRSNRTVSTTAHYVRHYFERGELRERFAMLDIIAYEERMVEDTVHRPAHWHAVAYLVARSH